MKSLCELHVSDYEKSLSKVGGFAAHMCSDEAKVCSNDFKLYSIKSSSVIIKTSYRHIFKNNIVYMHAQINGAIWALMKMDSIFSM